MELAQIQTPNFFLTTSFLVTQHHFGMDCPKVKRRKSLRPVASTALIVFCSDISQVLETAGSLQIVMVA